MRRYIENLDLLHKTKEETKMEQVQRQAQEITLDDEIPSVGYGLNNDTDA